MIKWYSSISLQGADPNCQNNDGEPALHVAVKNKHIDAIPVLIQEGADVNKKGPKYVLYLLFFSSVTIVKEL